MIFIMCIYICICVYMNIHIVYTYMHIHRRVCTKFVTLITSGERGIEEFGGEDFKKLYL